MALGLKHLRLVHRNDPRFLVQCGIDGCSYSGRSFSALYSHIYRTHKQLIQKREGSVSLQSHDETETAGPEAGPVPAYYHSPLDLTG